MWWIIHGLIVATLVYYVSCFFTFVFQCMPREKIWSPLTDGKCINFQVATLFAGVINLLLDVGIFLAPIWAIWLLQMPLHRKVGVLSVFGVGFL